MKKKITERKKMTHKEEIHDAILRKIQNSRTDDQGRGRKSRQCYHKQKTERGDSKSKRSCSVPLSSLPSPSLIHHGPLVPLCHLQPLTAALESPPGCAPILHDEPVSDFRVPFL